MTRRTRKTIFYALLCAFFLLGIGVVFYAQGWRMDLATGRIQKVGAIYVRSFPGDAHIFLNDEPVANQSWLLSRGTLINDLFPRTYRVTLTAPGYRDWHENATVAPSLVTTFNYAVLVPSVPASAGTTTLRKFFASQGTVAAQTSANAIMLGGTVIGHGQLVAASADLGTVAWKNAANGNYVFYRAAANTSTNISPALAAGGISSAAITSLVIDPYDATTFIGRSGNEVWIFDAAHNEVSFVGRSVPGAPAPAISPSGIAWISQMMSARTSTIAFYVIATNRIATSSIPLAGAPRALAWAGNNDFGVLQEDGSLFLYHADTHEFQKLADDVTDFAAMDDGSVIAALEHHSLEIFPFTDALTYRRFNLPNAADATGIAWYKDANHLFVTYPDHVSFLDVNDLSLRNFATVAQGVSPLYKPQENTLYLLNFSGKLQQFDFPS